MTLNMFNCAGREGATSLVQKGKMLIKNARDCATTPVQECKMLIKNAKKKVKIWNKKLTFNMFNWAGREGAISLVQKGKMLIKNAKVKSKTN